MATPAPTAKAKFLAAHPVFAAANAAGRKTWLANHPNWAKDWATATAPPPAPGKATIGAGNPANQPDRTGTPWVPAPTTVPVTPPANLSPPAAPQDPATTTTGRSASALIASTLAAYGLPATLATWAWGQYLASGNTDQVFLDLRQRPEYAARFPGMAELAKDGRAMSEGQYITAETTYKQQMRAFGLPETFYDAPDDFGKLISHNVSASEFNDRLSMAEQAAMTDPRGIMLRDELATRYAGVVDPQGAATAFFIDPDKTMDIVKKQYTAAAAATASRQSGFGSLSTTEAERVGAGMGISAADAAQAGVTFGQIGALKSLTQALPGEAQGTAASRSDLLDMGFSSDAEAKKRVTRAGDTRAAAFKGGGSFATTQGGVSGLGTSNA